MADNATTVFQRNFDAAPDAVWNALVDPSRLAHWWGPRGAVATTQSLDLRAGGEWRYVLHIWGANLLCHAVFTAVAAPERLVLQQDGVQASWRVSRDGASGSAVEVTLRRQRGAQARDAQMTTVVQQSLQRLCEYLDRHRD